MVVPPLCGGPPERSDGEGVLRGSDPAGGKRLEQQPPAHVGSAEDCEGATLFIDPIAPEQAEGLTAELYEAEIERFGFLSEYVQAFSHHPEAFRDWETLVTTLFRGMDRRRCELVTLAASKALKSTCCSVAHGRNLRDRFFTTDQVIQIATDHHDADLDQVDVAVMDFAEKIATDPTSTTQADIDQLKSLGLTDREIFDVVFAVAARAFLVTVIESLGNTAEGPWVDDLEPELLEALAVGRSAK